MEDQDNTKEQDQDDLEAPEQPEEQSDEQPEKPARPAVDNDRKPRDITVAEIKAAIPGTGGITSMIARKLGVEWHTAERLIEKHTVTRTARQNEKNMVADKAESNIIQAIMDGDVPQSKWYLEKKAKDRGYGESVELNGNVATPMTFDDWFKINEAAHSSSS